jgi:hypothetical protein
MSPWLIISVKKYRDMSHASAGRMPNHTLMKNEVKMNKCQIANSPQHVSFRPSLRADVASLSRIREFEGFDGERVEAFIYLTVLLHGGGV